ncbi:MAG: TerC/Alx family metal homeostasis membrane protein [Casimicrobiaceae bacterium]
MSEPEWRVARRATLLEFPFHLAGACRRLVREFRRRRQWQQPAKGARQVISGSLVDWGMFGAVVLAGMAADFVAQRAGRTRTRGDALVRSALWIGLGLLFSGWIALRQGSDAGVTYLTAYLLEKSLSVDNLFLFVLIFAQTGIPAALQVRALFWGVIGALVMRAVMIALGVYLLERFHWVIYPFAGILLISAWRMLFAKEAETKLVEASCALCTSWVGRILPIRPYTTGPSFFVRERGRLMATPLLVALVVIETTDLIFAVDSIPAVLAVTRDPFIVYTSNVFALLGLRSLYFVLSGAIRDLRYLRPGLGLMLLFVAVKMLVGDSVHVPAWTSLLVIALIFGAAIGMSLLWPDPQRRSKGAG